MKKIIVFIILSLMLVFSGCDLLDGGGDGSQGTETGIWDSSNWDQSNWQ